MSADPFDPLCSALAINCCQFSACIPSTAMATAFQSPSELADWMSHADDQIELRDLVLPGTHDSASCTISGLRPFSAVGRTQNLGILGQLKAGARYLDIRFAASKANGNGLSIWHGALEGGKFTDVLNDIKAFLMEHKEELLVLEFAAEYGRELSNAQKNQFLELIKKTFGDMLADGTKAKDWPATKLKEFRRKNWRIIGLLHNRFDENDYQGKSEVDIAKEFGIVTSQTWMQNRWHNTREVDALLQGNVEDIDKKPSTKLLHSQFVLTPGVGGLSDVLNAVLGKNSLQPIAMTSKLYQPGFMDVFIREHAHKKWNLVMLDAIDRATTIVQFLVSLNSASKLKVEKAAAAKSSGGKPLDVTDKMQSFVCRDRVLLLSNVKRDLDLPFMDGALTIACQIDSGKRGEKSYCVWTVDFGPFSRVIISPMAHSTGSQKVELSKEGGNKYVTRGDLFPEPKDFDGERAPALKFKAAKKGAFEFEIHNL